MIETFKAYCEEMYGDPQPVYVKETEWDDVQSGESFYVLSVYIMQKPNESGNCIMSKFGVARSEEPREERVRIATEITEKFLTDWLKRPVTMRVGTRHIKNWIMYDELPMIEVGAE